MVRGLEYAKASEFRRRQWPLQVCRRDGGRCRWVRWGHRTLQPL